MPTRTERRSEICDTCGAVATIEYTAIVLDDAIDHVSVVGTCPNVACATRHHIR